MDISFAVLFIGDICFNIVVAIPAVVITTNKYDLSAKDLKCLIIASHFYLSLMLLLSFFSLLILSIYFSFITTVAK